MKFQSIQALRALAAIMVIVFHSSIIIPQPDIKGTLWTIPGFTDFGFFGVNLFFVISGFIIADVLSKESFSILSYFKKRFFRIYPLLWVSMLLGLYHYYICKWFSYEFVHSTQVDPLGLIKSALIFPQADYPFWQPAWTLEHEVIFYLIAVIIAPFFGLRALAILLLCLGTIGSIFNVPWDYHLTAYAQIYFAAGIAAYGLKNQPLFRSGAVALIALGLSYARIYGVINYDEWLFHYTFAFGWAALIVSMLHLEKNHIKIPKVLVSIGDASYSLYLLHWLLIPIMATFRDIFGGNAELWRWGFVLVSLGVAFLSYNLFEKPIISFSHRTFGGFLHRVKGLG
ncbi:MULTISPECIES: acyltransferase family protein [Citrobacter]|nr:MULTISPECIES: acyltransferase [Citrobacter]MBJ8366284.1 acyltransferase [Citrobacter cronae]MBJ8395187.1 acyltransferase [Citrobacter cronae]MBJ8406103.1 acyltransferase [Citrobacter cronae]MBJ8408054.1 acyltransferase [Citrobacter cronae]MDE9718503.1 acyltransferase [Citrobacter cronae]